MGFFDSQVVQEEAKKLFEDYQSLMQLGSEYGKFDREGKKMYIERMETAYGTLPHIYEAFRAFRRLYGADDRTAA